MFLKLLLVMIFMMPQASAMAAMLNNANSAVVVSATVPTQIEVANVRWLVNKDPVADTRKLRLVIDTTGTVKVSRVQNDNDTSQLVIDLQGVSVSNFNNSMPLDGEIADKVTFSQKNANDSQIVVSLSNSIDDSDYKIFTLPSDNVNHKSFRVVIDITKPEPKVMYNFTAGLNNKVIAIDPGHGGSDPGAIGANNTQEKTITLAVAQKVKILLEKAGAKVLLTRQTDVDVYGPNASAADELQARAMVANNNKADVFLSIHINSFSNPAVGGTATYYYQKSSYSAMLAQNIQDNLVKTGGLQDRGISSARFYVLKRTEMPAVLAELAFISNPNEETMLNTPQFQQQMAQGIV
ncbi:MAG TPA: N-acetylmuramoyl-L-alanine amidase, partial [Negativicutes bacterium]